MDKLGNDIRRELVVDEGDSVAQEKFALFQPLNLEQIGAGRDLEGFDGGVEVAMLLLQARKLCAELAFFLCCHRATVVGGRRAGRRNPNKYRALSHKHQAMRRSGILNG